MASRKSGEKDHGLQSRRQAQELGDTDEAPAGAGSILKALRILETIVEAREPVSMAEISAILNYTRPTTHRIAQCLEELGYLEREPGSRRFVESQRFIDLALNVLKSAAQRPSRRSILNWVVEQTNETCNFGVMQQGELIYLDRIQANWPLGLHFQPGSRVPVHCTAIGKLFMAMLEPDKLDALLKTTRLTKYTESTIVDKKTLREALDKIRQTGVSVDNEEFMSGVVCVAVPVLDASGTIRAGLAISAPEARMSADRALEHVPVLRAAAERMQAAMFAPASEPGRKRSLQAELAEDLAEDE